MALRPVHAALPALLAALAACDGGTAPLPPLDGRIEGVARVEGALLAGLQLRIAGPDGSAPRIAVTDERGEYRLEGLDEGAYDVQAIGIPDHVEVVQPLLHARLERDRATARVDFQARLKRDASVAVQVLVEETAVGGVEVALDGPERRSGLTDTEGRVAFTELPRGTYQATLSAYDAERLAFSRESITVTADGRGQAGVRFSGIRVPRIPASPTSFAAAPDGPSAVELSWTDEADNESRFELQRRLGGDTDWTDLATPGADLAGWRDEGLAPATAAAYRLRACNVHGCSEPWLEADALTDDVPPAAPLDPAAVASGPTAVSLTWTDASANEERFEVDRRRGADGPWAAAAVLGAGVTAWVDGDATTGVEHGYRVRACNGMGCSPDTEVVTATPRAEPPGPPEGLSATAVGPGRVELSWSDPSGSATGFLLDRRTGSGAWSEVAALTLSAWSDEGVVGATTYRYRVRGCNGEGCSAPSDEVAVTTPAPPPNLDVGAAYVVQRVQRLSGDVPLVAGLDGLLRVFPRADRAGVPAVPVRVDFMRSGSVVQSVTVAPPVALMPTTVDESSLAASWNAAIPASLMEPGLALRIVVDPDGTFAEADEGDNAFPAGPAPFGLDIRATPPFRVTFVPVRQSANGLVGGVDAGNAGGFLSEARRMMPFAEDEWTVHAEFVSDQPALASDGTSWGAILSEVAALRAAEGSSRAYYGVVRTSYSSGVAGIGYVGWPIALGWDRSGSRASVAAHEWGHNFGRPHSPGCGAGNPDGAYPHAQGRIGAWGLDLASGTLRSPASTYDLMTYCGPEWISDYVYERVLDFRGPAPVGPAPVSGAVVDGLLVWGRVEAGRLVLEPAFDVRAPVSLPERPGRYRIEGRDADGAVFTLSFDPIPVADGGADEGHFAFVVPLDDGARGRLRELRLTDGARTAVRAEAPAGPAGAAGAAPGSDARVAVVDGTSVEVSWDAGSRPMALVRDADTGEILTFGRGGTVRLNPAGRALEIVLSDGVGTRESRVERWR